MSTTAAVDDQQLTTTTTATTTGVEWPHLAQALVQQQEQEREQQHVAITAISQTLSPLTASSSLSLSSLSLSSSTSHHHLNHPNHFSSIKQRSPINEEDEATSTCCHETLAPASTTRQQTSLANIPMLVDANINRSQQHQQPQQETECVAVATGNIQRRQTIHHPVSSPQSAAAAAAAVAAFVTISPASKTQAPAKHEIADDDACQVTAVAAAAAAAAASVTHLRPLGDDESIKEIQLDDGGGGDEGDNVNDRRLDTGRREQRRRVEVQCDAWQSMPSVVAATTSTLPISSSSSSNTEHASPSSPSLTTSSLSSPSPSHSHSHSQQSSPSSSSSSSSSSTSQLSPPLPSHPSRQLIQQGRIQLLNVSSSPLHHHSLYE